MKVLKNCDYINEIKNIPDKSIDLILTDPPYGMNYQSNMRKDKYDKIINDDNLDFLPELFIQIKRIIKNDGIILMFCSFHNIDIFKRERAKKCSN